MNTFGGAGGDISLSKCCARGGSASGLGVFE